MQQRAGAVSYRFKIRYLVGGKEQSTECGQMADGFDDGDDVAAEIQLG